MVHKFTETVRDTNDAAGVSFCSHSLQCVPFRQPMVPTAETSAYENRYSTVVGLKHVKLYYTWSLAIWLVFSITYVNRRSVPTADVGTGCWSV